MTHGLRVCALLLLMAAPLSAGANGGSAHCESLFQRVRSAWAQPAVSAKQELRQLQQTKLADIFPESVTESSRHGLVHQAKVEPAQIQKLKDGLNRLAEFHVKSDATGGKEFQTWMKQKIASTELNPIAIEAHYKPNGYTLRDIFDDLICDYVATHTKDPSRIKRLIDALSPELAASARALARIPGAKPTASLARWLYTRSKGILFFSVAVPIVAGGVHSFTDPVVQFANQQVTQHFGWLSQEISEFLINPEEIKDAKKELASVNQDLENLDEELRRYNFDGMSEKEARALWKQLETRYSMLMVRLAQTLPSNLSGGRGFFFDNVLKTPMFYSNNITGAESLRLIARSQLEKLNEDIQTSGTPGTPAQLKRRAELEQKIVFAEKEIAMNFAAWTLYQFAHAEVAREPKDKRQAEESKLMSTAKRIGEYLGMNDYSAAYSDEIRKAMIAIDAQLASVYRTDEEKAARKQRRGR